MPLAELYLVVFFTYEYSLIQPRLLTDEFLPDFVGRALVEIEGSQADAKSKAAY